MSVAKLKLADLEKQERSKLEGQQRLVEGTAFFRDLAKEYLERLDGMPNLKPRTKEYYKERVAAMQKSWAELNDTDVRRLDADGWIYFNASLPPPSERSKTFPREKRMMKYKKFLRFAAVASVCGVLGWLPPLARGDVLTGTNGERFVGTVVKETPNRVVFDSELGGRLTFPRSKIRDLQRTPIIAITNTAIAAVVVTNAPTNAISWTPPGVGHDGSDWVQLKSGEWLRGQLKYIQNKEVEFDSDELDQQTLNLKDVSKAYTAHRMFTQFEDRQPVYGMVVISNELVMVSGPEPLALHRDLLMGITPSGGRTGIRNWSGNFNLGLSLQSGNNQQTTVSTSAELARRTPNTTLLLDYLGNYSQVNNVQSANNERVNLTYDIRINQDWFVRPIQLEYYQDTLANISYRLTGGVGAGYYIFDCTGLEWTVSAGPSYQYTRFETVEPGRSDSATTPAAVLNSNFKADLTQRLTFIQSWQSTFTDKEAGQYTHHSVSTLEFEIKRHLNLDVSFIWDYLQNPQTRADGVIPQNSDYYLTVGFGVRF